MNLPYVYDYTGQHSVTFTVNGVTKNTWTDWGLIPSSRHSEPIHDVWSNAVTVQGMNGQEDLVRKYPYNAVNSHSKLRNVLENDNRDKIMTDSGYDIYLPMNGSFGFIIADQEESFFTKQQQILNFLHGQTGTMKFQDDEDKTYNVLFSVDAIDSGETFSSISISYTVLNDP